MKTRVDEALRAEARAYTLRFACDDCVHFQLGSEACSLGYPASPRRSAVEAECASGRAEGRTGPLFGHSRVLEFCKSFELA